MVSLQRFDLWRLPALALWGVFFLVGLFPELTFALLRDWGRVVTQTAAVNSVWILVVSLIAFITYYVYAQAKEVTPDPERLQRRALFTALLASVAFLPLRLEAFQSFGNIPLFEQRLLVYCAAGSKCVAWSFLGSLVFLSHTRIGARAFLLLPSSFMGLPESIPSPPSSPSPPNTPTSSVIREEKPIKNNNSAGLNQ